jgi:hypothetical protein
MGAIELNLQPLGTSRLPNEPEPLTALLTAIADRFDGGQRYAPLASSRRKKRMLESVAAEGGRER